ncbi:hypothetical protein NLJ89_g6602 [Agrocybe chaxingu]|uniref:Aminoglycoside phosphotransferase domain-containing protein n=1 Tax=Agrocybe chaxingu TaxID=84603 RepID=A0A9W8K0I0_9AGAR|nr:hypothetical protein NLJ89_g6602 [Agrocybe chaxingu]
MDSDSNTCDSYDSDEYPELHPNFDALQNRILSDLNLSLARWQKLTKGRYHEIYVLYTSPTDGSEGNKLIARFSRFIECPKKLQSEIATMRYVRLHTKIPVPEVYLIDTSPDNRVGAQYVVMQQMEGQHLYRIWDDLTIDHQKAVLCQIAAVLAQLANCKFDSIGCLQDDFSVGPLIHSIGVTEDGIDSIRIVCKGPFPTTLDYLQSFLEDVPHLPRLEPLMADVKLLLRAHFGSQDPARLLQPPFRLIHADFDAQNMLFTTPNNKSNDPPRLTAILDWEYAHTGPLYFLYDYPIFVQDADWSKELYSRNALLRRGFCHALRGQFEEGSEEHEQAKAILPAGKNSRLNNFAAIFMGDLEWDWDSMEGVVREYVQDEKQGTGKAYTGRLDWAPDPDTL